jgi:RHS repeat-associated protein
VNLTYTYDQLGRTTQIASTAGQIFANYVFNDKAQMSLEKINPNGGAGMQSRNFTYDGKGRLQSISGSLFAESLTYDNNGYQPSEVMYGGLVASTNVAYGNGGPTGNFEYKYQYDKYGRIVVADNNVNNTWDIGVGSPTTYDENGKIKTIKRGLGSAENYTYYPGTNKLCNTDGSTYDNFWYDSNGNVLGIDETYTEFAYDPFTMMTRYIWPDDASTGFQYDGAKERVLKVVDDGDITKTAYLRGIEDYPLMQKEDNGTERTFVYGPTGLIAVRVNSTWYYVLKDHLGSTRAVYAANGQISTSYDFDPYGQMVRVNKNVDPQYTFTGQEWDEEVSLYNFRARMYDPALGIFLAMDPAHQSHSPFGYCGGNPVMYIDKDGKFFGIVWAILGAWFAGSAANHWELNPWKWNWDHPAATIGAMVGGFLTGGFAAPYLPNPQIDIYLEGAALLGGYFDKNNNFHPTVGGQDINQPDAGNNYSDPSPPSGNDDDNSIFRDPSQPSSGHNESQSPLADDFYNVSLGGYSQGAVNDISSNGQDFISSYEGNELEAYLDTRGNWTVGRGHLMVAGDIPAFCNITQEISNMLFRSDIQTAANGVNRYIHAPLSQTQFDALASFAYQAGPRRLHTTGIARAINSGNYAVVPSLLNSYTPIDPARRRMANAILFQYGVYIPNQ